MGVMRCKMCGGSLIQISATVCECDSCGTRQTITNAVDGKKNDFFNQTKRLHITA